MPLFLLLNDLDIPREKWFMIPSENPILDVSPRLLAVLFFHLASLGNLFLFDKEYLSKYFEAKGDKYAFGFCKRKGLADTKFFELSKVGLNYSLFYYTNTLVNLPIGKAVKCYRRDSVPMR